jgi:hypothetical protein
VKTILKVEDQVQVQVHKQRKFGSAPFGYIWYRGSLVPNAGELIIVKTILVRHNAGFPSVAIAKELNEKSMRPRRAAKWDHSTVKKIAEKFGGNEGFVDELLRTIPSTLTNQKQSSVQTKQRVAADCGDNDGGPHLKETWSEK